MVDLLPYFFVAALTPALLHLSYLIFSTDGRYRLRWMVLSPFELAAIAALMLFAGSRLYVGTDYDLYARIFRTLSTADWSWSLAESQQEPGFTVLSLTIKSFGGDARSLFLLVSSLTVLFAYLAIRLASPIPALALATYILFADYLAPMNTVRQGLAVAMMVLVVVIHPRHRNVAVALAAIACTVHISAAVAIVLFLMMKWVRISSFGILVGVAIAGAGSRIIAAFPAIIDVLGGLNERYAGYVASGSTAGLGTVLVAVFHSVLALVLLRKIGGSGGDAQLWWLRIYSVTGPLAMLGTSVPIATRLSEYTAIFLPLLVGPFVIGCRNRSRVEVGIIGAGVVYMAMYLLNYGGLVPYQTWLFDAAL